MNVEDLGQLCISLNMKGHAKKEIRGHSPHNNFKIEEVLDLKVESDHVSLVYETEEDRAKERQVLKDAKEAELKKWKKEEEKRLTDLALGRTKE